MSRSIRPERAAATTSSPQPAGPESSSSRVTSRVGDSPPGWGVRCVHRLGRQCPARREPPPPRPPPSTALAGPKNDMRLRDASRVDEVEVEDLDVLSRVLRYVRT